MRPALLPTLALAILLPAGAALGSLPAAPTYIGTVTGNPEKDTFGAIVQTVERQVLCVTGPAHYFGAVTGNPEHDNYAYDTALVDGLDCPAATTSRRGPAIATF